MLLSSPFRKMTRRLPLRLFLALCIIGLLTQTAIAEDAPPSDTESKPVTEIVWEFDAYYSNVGIFVPLTDAPIPVINDQNEESIYRRLFSASFPPRFFLFEASVMPLPNLGVYLKKNHLQFYDDAEVGDVNLIESITAGFKEPYALTLFFGNVATFVREGEEHDATNKGYMGYLFSVGHQHIKDNELINDRWLQVEWKLKGDREFDEIIHRWSFRIGTFLHENRDVADLIYLGVRRSNLDFNAPFLSLLKNSQINLRADFSTLDGDFLGGELIVGKKYPFPDSGFALNFDIGGVWEKKEKYGPRYRDSGESEFTLVLRPNIEF
ncbi:MAG: hypothetical protein C0624_08860 [Desulfuromonas sp.]|nr:MAG: hypothetical protein C0624_08860 [Desulfuromonas sp.]